MEKVTDIEGAKWWKLMKTWEFCFQSLVFWKGSVDCICCILLFVVLYDLDMSMLWGPRKGALSWDDYFMGPLPIVGNASNIRSFSPFQYFPTPGLAFLTAMRSKDPSTQDTKDDTKTRDDTTQVANERLMQMRHKWSETKIGKTMPCETFKVWFSTPGRSVHCQRPKSHHWSRCIGQSECCHVWLFLRSVCNSKLKNSRLQWYAKQLPEWRSSLGKEVYFRLGKLSQLSK